MKRLALLERLRATPRWDVLVVGGGATGLGCAVEAASRGYSTLLLEARDFAKGTSSRSTKLIHGGVRYLAQGRIGLVREALAERALLLANAPHLVHPQRFVVPVYRHLDRLTLGIGLSAYDWLAGQRSLGPSRLLSAGETLTLLPTVENHGLLGGIAYMDARFDDARLAISLMRTVIGLGGLALNYLPVEQLLHDKGRVSGVSARDAESGEAFEIHAQVVINAAGVWADQLRRLDDAGLAGRLRPSQGAHLVVDRDFLPGDSALLIPRTRDGRVLFMIPWKGKVLLGTTDTARQDLPEEPRPFSEEVDFILDTAGRYLPRAPARHDVRSAFAGLRPLIGGGASNTASLSREHVIEVSHQGLVTVAGGKWTTYRLMGEEIIDRAAASGGLPPRAGRSRNLSLHGSTASPTEDVHGCERAAIDALPGAQVCLHPGLDLSEAEVRHAVRHEQARNIEDMLARRHRALFTDARAALDCAAAVAAVMAEELGWTPPQTLEMQEAFRRVAEGFLVET
ncbi:glycerol-3-phosphate dehydrogenase/oxidase [Zoogloea dura]|uniref:Glycerol-3-phosphate dehydrogenase/oxidase n=1 Tax=Zoogloea dura TaxID=2728840 RepID=A0A848G0Q7_9RHOO|nr:glycerol-3-phosphate dehydrogenase/oxidase [Zoogloea dura]NML24645.1 glycerol-3-phosphate dehydrogenase/oxidase [Zoogloea dura]